MSGETPFPLSRHQAAGPVRMVRRFFALSLLVLLAAGGLAGGLMKLFGRPAEAAPPPIPPAFAVSTPLLLFGSVALNRALKWVRLEKQWRFRCWLAVALTAGGLFVGVQSYGLWTLFPVHRKPEEASLGVTAFASALTTLHGLHFLVAVLFVAFVTARACADRYDHEYYWGVTVCAWFWHVLGAVWMGILAVFVASLVQGF